LSGIRGEGRLIAWKGEGQLAQGALSALL